MVDKVADNNAGTSAGVAAEPSARAPAQWLCDRLFKPLMVLCGVLFVLDFFIERHPKVPGEGLPAFYGFIGLLTFVGVLLTVKPLRRLLQRPETFYATRAIDAEDYPREALDRLYAEQAPVAQQRES